MCAMSNARIVKRRPKMPRNLSKEHQDCELRPWTVNASSQKLLDEETVRLEKIISVTSHQKNAGYRGSSVLEKLPELIEFNSSLKKSMKKPAEIWKSASPTSVLSIDNQDAITPTVVDESNFFKDSTSAKPFSGNYKDFNMKITCNKNYI